MVKDFQNLPDTFPAPQHFSAAFMVERRPGERGCFPRRPSCQSCLLKTPRYLWLRGRSRPALSTRTFCSTEMLCVHAVQQHGGHCPHWGSWNCGQHDRIFTFILVHLNANVKFYFTLVYSNVKNQYLILLLENLCMFGTIWEYFQWFILWNLPV